MAKPERDLDKGLKMIASLDLRPMITVIGAGGTGSHMVWGLAQLHMALMGLGRPGLLVHVMDHDTVEPHNIGRQRFQWHDVGFNKAESLVQAVNRAHGLDWTSSGRKAGEAHYRGTIVITCVDDPALRKKFHKEIRQKNPRRRYHDHEEQKRTHYWMDIGNDVDYGQVVLTNGQWPTIVDVVGGLDKMPTHRPRHSCSMEESLHHQDLFINLQMATIGLHMLWKLFMGTLSYRVAYVNMKDMQMTTVPITP